MKIELVIFKVIDGTISHNKILIWELNKMSDSENESIFPIANWDLGPIDQHQLIVFRPHFISSPGQTAEQAEISRYYAMTLPQAKELKASLEAAIAVLEAN